MKIGLYIDADYDKPGGVQEYVKGYYDFLEETGHTPVIIAPGKKEVGRKAKRRIKTLGRSIDFTTLRSSASLALTWSEKQELNNFLEREDLNVLHFMAPFGVLGFQLLENSHALNVATFLVTNTAKIVQLSLKTIFPLLTKRVDKLDGRIAISSIAYEFAKKYFPDSYGIIPPGVNTKRFNPKVPKLKKYNDHKVNILFVGRLDQRKGVMYLLKAYKQFKTAYPNCRLIIGGTGPKEKEAKRFVKDKKLRDVNFVGFIEQRTIPRYFSTADIFCSPATKDETFGIVLIEAFASGLPVVAFANEGYKTVIEGDNLGFLVKNKSVDALAQALFTLLTNKSLRGEIGKTNLEIARDKYAWNIVGNRILEFYKSLHQHKS